MKLCNKDIAAIRTTGKIQPIDGGIYWHIDKLTTDMSRYQIILTFEQLFKRLQPYFKPEFRPTGSKSKSQITLRFMKNGDSGLPQPFNQGTLAYAYLANNTRSKGFTSDIFFNDRYIWAQMHGSRGSISLLKVAIHEALHALGLQHSNDRKDILYPTYQANNNIVLTDDTVKGITSLYGKPVVRTRATNYPLIYGELYRTNRERNRLTEDQLLIMAANLGIKADKKDRKSDTAKEVFAKI